MAPSASFSRYASHSVVGRMGDNGVVALRASRPRGVGGVLQVSIQDLVRPTPSEGDDVSATLHAAGRLVP